MSEIEVKIVKQLEYYFGDLNLAKDKFLKQLISSAVEGWISYEDMLKFPRLKCISDDKDVIRVAIQNSASKLIEANENGIRRNLELTIPTDIQSVTEMHLDKSLYIKGFKPNVTIDEIIEYIEQFGGPTLNVFMRRILKSKVFKGSVFAIFKEKEDAEKFLSSNEASNFMDNDMIRMWQTDYLASKKIESSVKQEEKEMRIQTVSANREALLDSRMTRGALFELTGFNSVVANENVDETVVGDFTDNRDTRTATHNLKIWLSTLLQDVAPVAWVEYFPSTEKVIVRLGRENSANDALEKLNKLQFSNLKLEEDEVKVEEDANKVNGDSVKVEEISVNVEETSVNVESVKVANDVVKEEEEALVKAEVEEPVVKAEVVATFKYQTYNLNACVLSGEAEKDYWRNILNEQSKKNKRFGNKGGRFGGPDRKRMRR